MLRSPAVIVELEHALARVGDREIAGFLLEDSDGRQSIRLAPNLVDEPGTLEVPWWWIERALHPHDRSGFRPIAFFHSHLSTLELSEADRLAMRRMAVPWLILRSLAGRLSWTVYGSVAKDDERS